MEDRVTDHELLVSLGQQIQSHVSPEYTISEGQSLQTELNALPTGSTVTLDGTFVGTFTIPDGIRVQGGTLVGAINGPTVVLGNLTHLSGVYITSNVQTSELVRYEQVSGGVMDGCLVQGHPILGAKRGIRVNGADLRIVNTRVLDCKAVGADSQAICGWQYTKRLFIDNCHLEGAGENVMFGGADAPNADALPHDIVIQRSTLSKPLAWKGSSWTVKNLFELKTGIGVILRQCVLEHLWQAGQVGYAVLLKTVNQDGSAPFSEVRDVLIESNQIRSVSGGFNLHRDPGANGYFGVPMSNVTIQRNVVDISKTLYGGTGYAALINGVDDLTIFRNTFRTDGATAFYFNGTPCQRFRLEGNIIPDNAYGIKGDGKGEGLATLDFFAPGHATVGNLFVTASPHLYPAGNRCELTLPADVSGYGA
jgi:hypothetical protein